MSRLRWLSAALLTLGAASSSHAQTASLSMLGLKTLFGQDAPVSRAASVLPWAPPLTGSLLRELPSDSLDADSSEEAEELPAPRRCEMDLLPAFVPECLRCWREQWAAGNFREAEMLAAIACRLDPTNVTARHALVLAELMHGLASGANDSPACASGRCSRTVLNESSDQVERSIEQTLRKPISLAFRDIPLREVVSELNMLVPGANVVLDRAALADAGMSIDLPLSLQIDGVSLKSALNLLLDQAKLAYIIRDQALQITTPEAAKGRVRTVTYSVADLVVPDCAVKDCALVKHACPQQSQAPGRTLEDLLMGLIQTTIAPNSWAQVGGAGTVQYFPLGMAIVVNQTADVQEEVAALLEALRRLQGQPPTTATPTRAAASCTEAGCCAADAAKSCPATAVKETLACGCDKNCACCQCATPARPQSVMLPLSGGRPPLEVSSDRLLCEFLGLMQAPNYSSGSIVAVSPPMVYVSGNVHPAVMPRGLQMWAPLFEGPGMAMPSPIGPHWSFEQWLPYPHPGTPYPAEPTAVARPSMTGHFQGIKALTGLTPAGTMTADLDNVCNVCPQACTPGRPQPAPQPVAAPARPVGQQNVHLVTPHLEAHCERLTSAGSPDQIMLEGDVNLICNRNGQAIHIQGQRVLVNLSDGTFTVESLPQMRPSMPVQTLPVQRTRAVAPAATYPQPASYAPTSHVAPPVPWQMLRPVRPIDRIPDEDSASSDD
jgi:hypothetical protein